MLSKITQLISKLKPTSRVLILGHSQADVDSFGSAAALNFLLQKKCKSKLGFPDKLSVEAQHLAEELQASYYIVSDFKNFDYIFLIDFSSMNMAGKLQTILKENAKKIIVLDHHARAQDLIQSKIHWIEKSKVSTAEMIFELAESCKLSLNERSATLLACGIIADSANFLVADHSTFKILAPILEKSKRKYVHILNLMRTEMDVSEKIASLKAAQRSQIFRLKNFVIASSNVSCFEATAARNLVKLGADVGIVVAKTNHKTRLSVRCHNSFLQQTNFDASRDIMQALNESQEFGGNGGGHPGAAGFTADQEADEEKLLNACVELTANFLKKKFPSEQLKKY